MEYTGIKNYPRSGQSKHELDNVTLDFTNEDWYGVSFIGAGIYFLNFLK